jgi:hypothetical protein
MAVDDLLTRGWPHCLPCRTPSDIESVSAGASAIPDRPGLLFCVPERVD